MHLYNLEKSEEICKNKRNFLSVIDLSDNSLLQRILSTYPCLKVCFFVPNSNFATECKVYEEDHFSVSGLTASVMLSVICSSCFKRLHQCMFCCKDTEARLMCKKNWHKIDHMSKLGICISIYTADNGMRIVMYNKRSITIHLSKHTLIAHLQSSYLLNYAMRKF